MLFLCLSSSRIFASISSPIYEDNSLTLLTSIREAGKKPLTPISTISPPLTDSITVPLIDFLLSEISCISPHAFSYTALFTERINLPSSSSLSKTKACIFSPSFTNSFGFTPFLTDNSLEGITPSDLYPTSTITSFLSTRTIVPSITSPLLKDTNVCSSSAGKSSGFISSGSSTTLEGEVVSSLLFVIFIVFSNHSVASIRITYL